MPRMSHDRNEDCTMVVMSVANPYYAYYLLRILSMVKCINTRPQNLVVMNVKLGTVSPFKQYRHTAL